MMLTQQRSYDHIRFRYTLEVNLLISEGLENMT